MLLIVLQVLTLTSILLSGVQSVAYDSRVLQASSSHVLEVPAFQYEHPTYCDNNGDLYFKIVNNADDTGSYVLKLTPATQSPTTYKLPSSLSKSTDSLNFNVSSSGDVWFLDQNGPLGELYLIGFNGDGTVASQTRLDAPVGMQPEYLAISGSGIIFVKGFFEANSSGLSRQKTTYVALFDHSGKLRTKIEQESGRTYAAGKLPNEAVTVDGNGYFWYARPTGIAVISPDGEIFRQLSLEYPENAAVVRMQLADNLLSVYFLQSSGQSSAGQSPSALLARLLVLDTLTGHAVASYTPAPELGHSVVCFSPKDGFTFMRFEKGKVKLLSAPMN